MFYTVPVNKGKPIMSVMGFQPFDKVINSCSCMGWGSNGEYGVKFIKNLDVDKIILILKIMMT